MNPIYQELIKALVRKVLTAAATYLLAAGLVDEHLAGQLVSETTAIVLGLILLGGSLVWSYGKTYAQAYFQRNLAEAGASTPATSPDVVVARAVAMQRDGNKPGPIVAGKAVVSVLLALGLTVPMVACGGIGRPATADGIARDTTRYATDAVEYVTEAQTAVTAYAAAQGGRTPETDRVSAGIRDQVIPAARRLESVLKRYAATSTVDLKSSTEIEIAKALTEYESVATAVLAAETLPPQLSQSLATTVVRIRELVANLRAAFIAEKAILSLHVVRMMEVTRG